MLNSSTKALEDLSDEPNENFNELSTRLHLERGLIRHYYHQDELALDEFKKSQRASELVWELTGALGKRTKFQTFDITQLVVLARSGSEASEDSSNIPNNLALNDDTILENIALTNANDQSALKPIDRAILLAFCLNVKNMNPAHGLTKEEMMPFVSRVLQDANNWMIHTMGLLLRSRLEGDKSRTVERSVLQLQAIVDQFKANDDKVAPVSERIDHIFSILLPPIWNLEVTSRNQSHLGNENVVTCKNEEGIIKELGERLVSLGVVRSALEIFLRLEMWEDAISCYQVLQESQEAEILVLRLLKERPYETKLTCILGDIRKDPTLYEKAWEDSKHRNARAMRSLGAHYFKKEQFQKSVECYANALKINPLFENSWFIMGCAAMHIEDWETAMQAFSRVVSLDTDAKWRGLE
ncbi:hypothetical protein HK096_009769 [Nowakowskiella sp. JEL0078]|nr:hypothetical protein HK096_009769 [Nowakowskiella sp. JEL0078]